MVTMASLQGNVEPRSRQSSDMKREFFQVVVEKEKEEKTFWGFVLINIAGGNCFDRKNGF